MQSLNTTTEDGWFGAIRLIGTLLVASGMMFAVGCDSNDSGMNGNGENNGNGNGDSHSVEAYDTTEVSNGPDEITVSDVEGGGIGYVDAGGNEVTEVTWTSDYVYKLDNFVFVNDGQTLNIEPGTMIKGLPGSGEDASALIVARGGQIYADGERDDGTIDPIIFTAEADDGSGLGRDVRGEWGGVILLGDATINSDPPTTAIEGVPEDIGGDRNLYGAENEDFNDDHDIGVFRYVSIRHTGTQLGGGDEIQGLTLGGVGSGSTIEYVESYASDDDGFEWFGGTVNTKYLIAAFVSDDSFDLDEGYRGSNQFWFAVQSFDEAGRIGEHDGGTSPEDGQPYATSKVVNATYIGVGPGADVGGDQGEPMLYQRDNNATSYYNSIFMDGRTTQAGLQIEDLAGGEEDSRERWLAGELRHESNLWWNVGEEYDSEGTTFEDIIQIPRDEDTGEPTGDGGEEYVAELADYLRQEGNQMAAASPIEDLQRNESQEIQFPFNPRAAGPATSAELSPASEFGNVGGVNSDLVDVDYHGAFPESGDHWAEGWTLLSQSGEIQ